MAVTKVDPLHPGTYNYFKLVADTAPTTGVPNGSRLTIVNAASDRTYTFLDGTWYSDTNGAALS